MYELCGCSAGELRQKQLADQYYTLLWPVAVHMPQREARTRGKREEMMMAVTQAKVKLG